MHDQTAVHARAHYQPAHRWIQLKRHEKTDPAPPPRPAAAAAIIRLGRWPSDSLGVWNSSARHQRRKELTILEKKRTEDAEEAEAVQ